MAFMISEMVAPPLRWSMAITWAILLPSRGPPPSFALAAFLAALGAFLAGVAFVVALWAARAPPLAFFPAFGFASSASGCAASPSPWMRCQMRLTAALLLLKLSTGVTPVRLLKIATSRSAGHALASSTSSFWLAKESKGVVVAAAASSGVPCAVMLLSESIVNVILNLLGAALCAVITSITRKHLKVKAFLK